MGKCLIIGTGIPVFDYKPFKPPFLVTIFDRNFDGGTVSETPTKYPGWLTYTGLFLNGKIYFFEN